MPASNYNSQKSGLSEIKPDETKLSAISQIKPMRDVNVRDSKDSATRQSSADSNQRNTPASIKEQVNKKRYISSSEGQKPASSAVSSPDSSKQEAIPQQ